MTPMTKLFPLLLLAFVALQAYGAVQPIKHQVREISTTTGAQLRAIQPGR